MSLRDTCRMKICYNSHMSENQTAVSVYSQDGMDDFPVLKAFQQYIDSEQAKARKRMVMLGVFFCILIGAIIAVFVAMLASVTARNQQLNDRLVEFAMRECAVPPAVAVNQPDRNDSAMMAMTARLDEMQKKLDESRVKAERKDAKPATPSAEEIEILRLKALLEIEQKKVAAEKERRTREEAAEKERRRQEELEAYRRKHYPELYNTQTQTRESAPAKPPRRAARPAPAARKTQDIDDEIDAIVAELDDDQEDSDAISYFDTEPKADSRKSKEDSYKIPVEVKKTGGRRWHVPLD